MVDKERCDDRHKGVNRRFTAIYGMVTVGLLVVGWAVNAGYSAQQKAEKVQNSLIVHEKVQTQAEKNRDETLKRIETAVEKIWTHIHGEPP